MIVIFIIKTAEDLERWEEFKKNPSYGKLIWNVEPPHKEVDFLDLTIQVENTGLITTKTLQKKMNIYVYIPQYSAHPLGLFKSIIYSTIRRYGLPNSTWEDVTNIVRQFYKRLLDRGYRAHNIDPTIATTLTAIATGISFYITDSLAPLKRK